MGVRLIFIICFGFIGVPACLPVDFPSQPLQTGFASQPYDPVDSVIAIVNKQLVAYNNHDVVAFAATYSDDITIYNIRDPKPFIQGQAQLQELYADFFQRVPGIHCEITN